MKFVSLFTGLGGMDLGLEWAGMRCVGQCEIDPYATRVLEKHWPRVRRHGDIHTFPPEPIGEWSCGILVGGPPCQPVSVAGKRLGEADERWLWDEYRRVISILRPAYVVIENVPGLIVRGLASILRDLAALGYDAEWDCIPANVFGLPHIRERVFIVAYPMCEGLEGGRLPVFHTSPAGRQVRRVGLSESDVVRKRNGIPNYVERIRGLGNAIVPQVAQWVGEQIMRHAGEHV